MSSALPPVPDVVAMIFADDIHHDLASGKFSILGAYSTIAASAFPWMPTAVLTYLALTDAVGPIPITVRLIDADEQRPPVFSSDMVVSFSDPLAIVETAIVAPAVVFPQPGEYRLQLLTGGQVFRERRLFLVFSLGNGHPAPQPPGGTSP